METAQQRNASNRVDGLPFTLSALQLTPPRPPLPPHPSLSLHSQSSPLSSRPASQPHPLSTTAARPATARSATGSPQSLTLHQYRQQQLAPASPVPPLGSRTIRKIPAELDLTTATTVQAARTPSYSPSSTTFPSSSVSASSPLSLQASVPTTPPLWQSPPALHCLHSAKRLPHPHLRQICSDSPPPPPPPPSLHFLNPSEDVTGASSTLSLSRFPYPPSGTVILPLHSHLHSADAHTLKSVPTPTSLRIHDTTFDLVNPHNSLGSSNIETPAEQDIHHSDYFHSTVQKPAMATAPSPASSHGLLLASNAPDVPHDEAADYSQLAHSPGIAAPGPPDDCRSSLDRQEGARTDTPSLAESQTQARPRALFEDLPSAYQSIAARSWTGVNTPIQTHQDSLHTNLSKPPTPFEAATATSTSPAKAPSSTSSSLFRRVTRVFSRRRKNILPVENPRARSATFHPEGPGSKYSLSLIDQSESPADPVYLNSSFNTIRSSTERPDSRKISSYASYYFTNTNYPQEIPHADGKPSQQQQQKHQSLMTVDERLSIPEHRVARFSRGSDAELQYPVQKNSLVGSILDRYTSQTSLANTHQLSEDGLGDDSQDLAQIEAEISDADAPNESATGQISEFDFGLGPSDEPVVDLHDPDSSFNYGYQPKFPTVALTAPPHPSPPTWKLREPSRFDQYPCSYDFPRPSEQFSPRASYGDTRSLLLTPHQLPRSMASTMAPTGNLILQSSEYSQASLNLGPTQTYYYTAGTYAQSAVAGVSIYTGHGRNDSIVGDTEVKEDATPVQPIPPAFGLGDNYTVQAMKLSGIISRATTDDGGEGRLGSVSPETGDHSATDEDELEWETIGEPSRPDLHGALQSVGDFHQNRLIESGLMYRTSLLTASLPSMDGYDTGTPLPSALSSLPALPPSSPIPPQDDSVKYPKLSLPGPGERLSPFRSSPPSVGRFSRRSNYKAFGQIRPEEAEFLANVRQQHQQRHATSSSKGDVSITYSNDNQSDGQGSSVVDSSISVADQQYDNYFPPSSRGTSFVCHSHAQDLRLTADVTRTERSVSSDLGAVVSSTSQRIVHSFSTFFIRKKPPKERQPARLRGWLVTWRGGKRRIPSDQSIPIVGSQQHGISLISKQAMTKRAAVRNQTDLLPMTLLNRAGGYEQFESRQGVYGGARGQGQGQGQGQAKQVRIIFHTPPRLRRRAGRYSSTGPADGRKRKKQLSWILFAVCCLFPPALVCFGAGWMDGVMVMLSRGEVEQVGGRQRRLALVLGSFICTVGSAVALITIFIFAYGK